MTSGGKRRLQELSGELGLPSSDPDRFSQEMKRMKTNLRPPEPSIQMSAKGKGKPTRVSDRVLFQRTTQLRTRAKEE
jgi:hypothetical protein